MSVTTAAQASSIFGISGEWAICYRMDDVAAISQGDCMQMMGMFRGDDTSTGSTTTKMTGMAGIGITQQRRNWGQWRKPRR